MAFLFAAVGLIVENNHHKYGDDYGYGDPKYDGNVIIGFSLAGVAVASGIVVAGMISHQRDEDAALRGCLYERGYSAP